MPNGGLLIMGVYVDDLVTLYSHEADMLDLYAKIKDKFEFTPQKPLVDICGIEVTETPGYVILTLESYITKLADVWLTPDEMAEVVKVPCAPEPTADTLEYLVGVAKAQDAESI